MTAFLIAQEPTPKPAEAKTDAPFFMNPLFMIAMLGLFFLVVMLPAQRRAKRDAANLLANLKTGSKVVTSSGIIGVVVKAKDGEEDITLKSEDTRLKVLRSSVVKILGTEETTEAK
jgi:preprotein translocase subunit YajC